MQDVWPAFKALVADLRDAPTVEEGARRLQAVVRQQATTFPEACRCLLEDQQASLNHLRVPLRHRQYVQTSNLAERAFEEERRRTKVIPKLWDEASLVKLVFGTLIRVSERWSKRPGSRAFRLVFGLIMPQSSSHEISTFGRIPMVSSWISPVPANPPITPLWKRSIADFGKSI